MNKLGQLSCNSDIVTNVITSINNDTKDSADPIATSCVVQLSNEFMNKLGDIDTALDEIIGE